MNFIGCIPRFLNWLKPYTGWILTGLGTIGTVGTVILAAKEAPEAKEALEQAQDERFREAFDAYPVENDEEKDKWWAEHTDDQMALSLWEKVKIATPIYLPAILMGVGSLGCFWGSQIFNQKTYNNLLGAYGALAMQFDKYRDIIRNDYGEEADKKAYLQSREEVRKLQGEIKMLREENGPFLYEFATLPGVIFEAKPAQIFNGLLHYNRNFLLGGMNDLYNLYSFCGLPDSCFDVPEACTYGWQQYENEVSWDCVFLDFEFTEVKNRDGRSVNIISPFIPPYEVNVDYGYEGNAYDNEHMYPGFDFDKARDFAKMSSANDRFIEVPKDHIVYDTHF